MNTAAVLLSAFVLSFVALLVFIWSQRTGVFDRRSKGAEVIFAPGEIGRVEEPAAGAAQQGQLQEAIDDASGEVETHTSASDLADCPGVCRAPGAGRWALGSEYQHMQRQLIADAKQVPANQRVRLLSVSVSFDVEHDGVTQLRQNARVLGADPQHWRWAVPATDTESRALLRSLGVVAIPDGAGGLVHIGDMHLLDGEGRLRGLFGFDQWPAALAAAREVAAR